MPEQPTVAAATTEAPLAAEELADFPAVRFLDPARLRFFRGEDGTTRLEVEGDRTVLEVRAVRLFPITDRRDFLSICDGGGEEIGIVRSLRSLPRPMRHLVLETLRKRYFVPQITYVHALRDEYGILYWDAETTRGRRRFVVRDVRDNIREFPGGRMQIADVDGNLFEIANIDALPGRGISTLYRLL